MAQASPLSGDAVERVGPYLSYAERFWERRGRVVNCPDGIQVWWQAQLTYAFADIGGCVVTVDPTAWRRLRPWARCQLMLHEHGHLVGLVHLVGKRRVMDPNVLGWIHPACRTFGFRRL